MFNYNYDKLRERILAKYGTYTAFAEDVGVSLPYVSMKLGNRNPLTQDDVRLWAEKLDISDRDIGAYFFCLMT